MLSTARWLNRTMLSKFVNDNFWVWPTLEILHFTGMCLLIGAIGLFDLRLLGMASRVPVAAMHRLVRWGILGFAINAATGICFVSGTPCQFIFNMAFQSDLRCSWGRMRRSTCASWVSRPRFR